MIAADSATPPAASSGESVPRYMKYRNSLSRSGGNSKLSETTKAQKDLPPASDPVGQSASIGAVAAGDATAAAEDGTAAVSGIEDRNSLTTEPTIPSYMRYRNSLVQSNEAKSSPASSTLATDSMFSERNAPVDVLADARPDEEESKERNATVGTTAKVGAAALAVGAGSARVAVAARNRSSDAGVIGTSSTPSYLRYRNSLAQSAGSTSLSANSVSEAMKKDPEDDKPCLYVCMVGDMKGEPHFRYDEHDCCIRGICIKQLSCHGIMV